MLGLTRVLAGPFCHDVCGHRAGDHQIEQAGTGTTQAARPFKEGESAYFMNLNRNKKGITLNLKNPKAGPSWTWLKSDVVIENFRPGTMEKLGLGYET